MISAKTKANENIDWYTTWESDEEEKNSQAISVPSHFKRYTIKGREIVVQKLVRNKLGEGQSYDFPNKSKIVDLAQEGEDPKSILISDDLDLKRKESLLTRFENTEMCLPGHCLI